MAKAATYAIRVRGSRSLTAASTVRIGQFLGTIIGMMTYNIEGTPYPPPLQEISFECSWVPLHTYHPL